MPWQCQENVECHKQRKQLIHRFLIREIHRSASLVHRMCESNKMISTQFCKCHRFSFECHDPRFFWEINENFNLVYRKIIEFFLLNRNFLIELLFSKQTVFTYSQLMLTHSEQLLNLRLLIEM